MKLLPKAEVRACALSRDVFQALANGSAQAAVIPIENSLAGSVTEHLGLLLKYRFFIQRELRLRIEDYLMAAHGVRLAAIRRVLLHPVALALGRRCVRTYG